MIPLRGIFNLNLEKLKTTCTQNGSLNLKKFQAEWCLLKKTNNYPILDITYFKGLLSPNYGI